MTELWALLEEQAQLGRELSYKAVYLWLKKVTVPRYGMRGPLLSFANRRRIWGVCEQLATHYTRQLRVRPVESPDPSISHGSTVRHMAILSSEKQSLNQYWEVSKALVLYSWDEIDNRPLHLVADWDRAGRLVNLSAVVGFGKSRRVRGIRKVGMFQSSNKRTTVRVAAGDRVSAIQLYIISADPNNGTTASTSVVSLRIHTRAGQDYIMYGESERDPKLPYISTTILPVSKGACLVGIVGHIDHEVGILLTPRCLVPLDCTLGFV
jgi:hypothetical protein